jgi:D-xylose transport system ATP-binding protein
MLPASSNGERNGAILQLEGVSKSFGPLQALEGVDFGVRPGEVVALVGDNGAGKSTLIKVISGIHDADSGRILFEGREVTIARPSDAVALGIATVHQDLALCDNLDVVGNLFLGREEIAPGVGEVLRSLDETDMEHRSHELLSNLAVTITDVRAEVGTMSVGQRQQVAIARSLLGDPKVSFWTSRPRRSACGKPARCSRWSSGCATRATRSSWSVTTWRTFSPWPTGCSC